MPWTTRDCREVEDAMRAIERSATVRAWLWAYDLLLMNPIPKCIPPFIDDVFDRYLLETLRKALECDE